MYTTYCTLCGHTAQSNIRDFDIWCFGVLNASTGFVKLSCSQGCFAERACCCAFIQTHTRHQAASATFIIFCVLCQWYFKGISFMCNAYNKVDWEWTENMMIYSKELDASLNILPQLFERQRMKQRWKRMSTFTTSWCLMSECLLCNVLLIRFSVIWVLHNYHIVTSYTYHIY